MSKAQPSRQQGASVPFLFDFNPSRLLVISLLCWCDWGRPVSSYTNPMTPDNCSSPILPCPILITRRPHPPGRLQKLELLPATDSSPVSPFSDVLPYTAWTRHRLSCPRLHPLRRPAPFHDPPSPRLKPRLQKPLRPLNFAPSFMAQHPTNATFPCPLAFFPTEPALSRYRFLYPPPSLGFKTSGMSQRFDVIVRLFSFSLSCIVSGCNLGWRNFFDSANPVPQNVARRHVFLGRK